MLTVRELIKYLETFDQELLVAQELYSEQVLLEKGNIGIAKLPVARPDGWIHDNRPDMTTIKYLLIADFVDSHKFI